MRSFLAAVTLACFSSFGPAVSAEERVSDAVPFERGDILVAASLMDDPDDDHKGTGRILQFDHDLQLKGTLWIDSTAHKIGGLNFAPDGTLWAMAPIGWDVIEVAPDATQRPVRRFADRSFSTVQFAPDGTLFFGEHLEGSKDRTPFNTTRFKYLEGRDVIGDGHVFQFTTAGELIKEYATDTHGGVVGIHGVNGIVLTDNGTRVIYFSETGNRLMQYDVANDKQLPDLLNGDTPGAPPMILFLTQLPDTRLVLATGRSFLLVDQNNGAILDEITMDDAGWAAIAPSIDDGHMLAGNFFTGEFVKLNVTTGKVVARGNIGVRESLSGIAQFPGLTK